MLTDALEATPLACTARSYAAVYAVRTMVHVTNGCDGASATLAIDDIDMNDADGDEASDVEHHTIQLGTWFNIFSMRHHMNPAWRRRGVVATRAKPSPWARCAVS